MNWLFRDTSTHKESSAKPGDKGASFGTIKFSKNLLIKYIISIFNLNAFMRELGKKICSFERPLPLLFFSKQKLVWLLKEALNVRREAACMQH